jgi:two-component system, NarL family, response regulator LiaR
MRMIRNGTLRVAVANDYELVVAGLAGMLASYAPRVEVAGEVVVGEPVQEPVDIVLYDTYGREGIAADALRSLLNTDGVDRVAVFTFAPSPIVEQTAASLGAAAVLPKTLSATELVNALEAIAEGREPFIPNRVRHTADERFWPGRERGLTERESEVVVLLAQGLRNQEIASALYVSIDTVKTHLRAAFRKLGVTNRAQATAAVLRDPAFGRVRV